MSSSQGQALPFSTSAGLSSSLPECRAPSPAPSVSTSAGSSPILSRATSNDSRDQGVSVLLPSLNLHISLNSTKYTVDGQHTQHSRPAANAQHTPRTLGSDSRSAAAYGQCPSMCRGPALVPSEAPIGKIPGARPVSMRSPRAPPQTQSPRDTQKVDSFTCHRRSSNESLSLRLQEVAPPFPPRAQVATTPRRCSSPAVYLQRRRSSTWPEGPGNDFTGPVLAHGLTSPRRGSSPSVHVQTRFSSPCPQGPSNDVTGPGKLRTCHLNAPKARLNRAPVQRQPPNSDISSVVGPGDVFFVKDGDSALARIGTSGGFFGHVLQVIGVARCLSRATARSMGLLAVWPSQPTEHIWVVRTLESTRGTEGLFEADSFFHIDSASCCVVMLGQLDKTDELSITCGEAVEVWQPPYEVRSSFMTNVMLDVIADMKNVEASWSIATAVRAVLMSAKMADSVDKDRVMKDIQSSWVVAPICTSVVIVFWQRYLMRLAQRTSMTSGAPAEGQAQCAAVELIRKFMPLKADRGLPGDLQTAMTSGGWSRTTNML